MTKRYAPHLVIPILLFTTLSTFSATFPVSGQVINRSGSPIPNATVTLSSSGDATTTDSNGIFGDNISPIFNSNIDMKSNIGIQNRGLVFSRLIPNSDVAISLNDLRGRKVLIKRVLTNSFGAGKVDLLNSSQRIADGVYIINFKSKNSKMSFKTIIRSNNFVRIKKTKSIAPNNTATRTRAVDTLNVSCSGYQSKSTPINTQADSDLKIVLDPFGLDNIPVLYPDVSGKIYIRNGSGAITDTLKAYSVMPAAGIQEWSDVVSGSEPTGVVYDSTLTTSTTMKAHMIRAGMQDSNDWQISFATAIVGKNPFDKLSHIIIRYMVESHLDSIALSLNAVNGSDVIGESDDHGAFRSVLKKGVANPGEFVTDTLSMEDFTIAWAIDQSLEGISLADYPDSIDNCEAIAFSNEMNPWDYDQNAPKNDGDTVNITVAGILFGTQWDTVIIDTTIDTTISNYPMHRNIMTSTFWCGEGASGDNDFITNTTSAWDVDWGSRFGIEDEPFLSRDSDFIPTSSKYTGKENPYYFALPYNDMGPGVYDGSGPDDNSAPIDGYWRKENAYTKVYWADEMTPSQWASSNSMCKNRWIRVNVAGGGNKFCYAQWEDAGPYYYNDHEYVWGTADPSNTTDSPYSGIDLSPSVCLYLGQTMQEWGAPSFEVDWCFVDEEDVPDGPWKRHVTTTQINW